MEKTTIKLVFQAILISLLLQTSACQEKETTILPEDVQLKEGDLVFRQGRSMASHIVTTADRSGCYSHIGIVVDSAGYPRIIHAIPDEHDYPGDMDRVKMDRPEIFFLSSRAKIGEVMRPKNSQKAHIAAQTAKRIYDRHTLFDHNYNAQDSTKMYCTELILYAYRSAGLDLAAGPLQDFTFPIHFHGYFPSAIHASPELISVRIF